MPAWVVRVNRIVEHIGITIDSLWSAGNKGIGLEESAKHGRIETCLVVHQSAHAGGKVTLACVGEVGGRLGIGTRDIGPLAAEGEVALLGC